MMVDDALGTVALNFWFAGKGRHLPANQICQSRKHIFLVPRLERVCMLTAHQFHDYIGTHSRAKSVRSNSCSHTAHSTSQIAFRRSYAHAKVKRWESFERTK